MTTYSRVYPSLHDLDEYIDNAVRGKSKLPNQTVQRLRTIQSRLRPLLLILGEMSDCSSGFPIPNLLDQKVVLELDGLTEEMQSFAVTLLFYAILSYRMNSSQRNIGLQHVLIADEAKLTFSKEVASGRSPMARLVSTAREFGQGMVFADQMPSTLGHSVMANVSVMISLNLRAMKDISEISYAMGLNSEQRTYLSRLPLGLGIVKT